MTTVTSPTPVKRANIVVPTTQPDPPSVKKDAASKDRPEFVVSAKGSDSNAPVGVSVSKFNKNHIVVRDRLLPLSTE